MWIRSIDPEGLFRVLGVEEAVGDGGGFDGGADGVDAKDVGSGKDGGGVGGGGGVVGSHPRR